MAEKEKGIVGENDSEDYMGGFYLWYAEKITEHLCDNLCFKMLVLIKIGFRMS